MTVHGESRGAALALTPCSAKTAGWMMTPTSSGAIVWPILISRGRPTVADAIIGRNCQIGRNATFSGGVLGDKTEIAEYSRLYESRHLQSVRRSRGLPDRARRSRSFTQIGRAFVAFLKAKTDRRRAATCGCRHQPGRSVHRWRAAAGGRRRGLRDDRHRHAVLRRGGPTTSKAARRSPRHTIPSSTTAARWCGKGNVPLSGDNGISDIRDMIARKRIPPPAAIPGCLIAKTILEGYVRHVIELHRSVHHQAVQDRPGCRLRHGGAGGAGALQGAAVQNRRALLHDRRHLPHARSQPADRREPARHRRAAW